MTLRTLKPLLFLAAGMLLLLVVTVGFVFGYSRWSVERQIEALRAAGEPVSAADLQGPPIPDEENAFAIIKSVEAEVGEMWDKVDFTERISLCIPCDLSVRAAAMDQHPRVWDALRRASAATGSRPVGRSRSWRGNTDEGVYSFFREISRTVQNRGRIEAVRGRRDAAIEDVILLMVLSRHANNPPDFIGWVSSKSIRSTAVDLANTTLRMGPVSSEKRESLDQVLKQALADEAKEFRDALRGDRAWHIDQREQWKEDLTWYQNIIEPVDTSANLREIGEELILCSEPLEILLRDIENQLGSDSWTNKVYWFHTHPSQWRFVRGSDVVQMRSLRVLLALLRLGDEGKPMDVGIRELGLSDAEIMDPFSGKPLGLKHTPRGPVIYSVGWNKMDDGGEHGEGGKDDRCLGPNQTPVGPKYWWDWWYWTLEEEQ